VHLYLARHAAVVPRPDQPAASWHLSPAGRSAAEALAAANSWPALARLYSSAEPKAIATAQRIAARNGLPLSIEPRLCEVERPWTEDDYRELAHHYLRGEAVEGWEERSAASKRIDGAVRDVVAAHGAADVGIVSHGLVLSLYLAGVLGLDGPATVDLWEGIDFADYAILDPSARRLLQPFRGRAFS
jgi:broad specificity phosphatase PhoE